MTSNKIETVFVLLVFCVFVASVLLVLTFSASAYQNMIYISRDGQDERILLSYVRTKIRNTDSAGGISVGDFHGLPALILREDFGGNIFLSYIYLYDGWLRELFHEAGQDFMPEAGLPVIRAGSLYFDELENGLIRVSTDYGFLLIYPRSYNGISTA